MNERLSPPAELHPAFIGMRSTTLGIALNAVLAVIKGTAGILGHSQALIADAVESATDVLGSLVVWAGLRVAARPADTRHPYGYGKAEPLATAVVSLALIGAAIGIAAESVHQIRTPHQVPASYTLAVLIVVIAVKEILFRYVLSVGLSTESLAVQGDAWHHRSDALTSLAAFIGIVIALIGGPGWESADDWAALFASGIILFNAQSILRPAVHELMDRAPNPEIEYDVRQIAATVEGVRGLHRCRVRKMGFEYFIDLDVIVDRELPVHIGHEIAHRVQDAVRASIPRIQKVFVHIEPHEDRAE